MKNAKVIGKVLATAAAIAFTTSPIVSTAAPTKQVMCYGVNSCRGKSVCTTAVSSCKGNNACRGKGALIMSKKECLKRGGKF